MWNAEALRDFYNGYWNAPIFFPLSGSFALSEPQQLSGFLFSLSYFSSGSEVLSYNLVLLFHLTLNGFAGCLLGHSLGSRFAVSVYAGIVSVFLPYVASELGVLQLVTAWIPLLSLSSIFLLARTRDYRFSFLLGTVLLLGFLSCLYYAVYSVSMIIVGFIFYFIADREFRLLLPRIVLCVSPFLLVISIIAFSQYEILEGRYVRSLPTQINTSAKWVDYLGIDERSLGGSFPWLLSVGIEQRGELLFPGTVLLLSVFFGFFVHINRKDKIFCYVGMLFSFVLSMLPKLVVSDFHLFTFISDIFPFISQMRSFFRSAILVQVFSLCFFIFVMQRYLSFIRLWGGGVLVLFFILEVYVTPQRLFLPKDSFEDRAFLAEISEIEDGAAIILPPQYWDGELANDYIVYGMVDALFHRKPLVNGYSGFVPDSYRKIREVFSSSLKNLESRQFSELGIRYVFLHEGLNQTVDVQLPSNAELVGRGRIYSVYFIPK